MKSGRDVTVSSPDIVTTDLAMSMGWILSAFCVSIFQPSCIPAFRVAWSSYKPQAGKMAESLVFGDLVDI